MIVALHKMARPPPAGRRELAGSNQPVRYWHAAMG